MCSKFTGEYQYGRVITIKLQSNLFEITLRHVRSPVNLLHIFRTPFPKNTYGGLASDMWKIVLEHSAGSVDRSLQRKKSSKQNLSAKCEHSLKVTAMDSNQQSLSSQTNTQQTFSLSKYCYFSEAKLLQFIVISKV